MSYRHFKRATPTRISLIWQQKLILKIQINDCWMKLRFKQFFIQKMTTIVHFSLTENKKWKNLPTNYSNDWGVAAFKIYLITKRKSWKKKLKFFLKTPKCFLVVALVGVQWRARARLHVSCRAVVVDGLAAGYWLDVSVFGHLDDQESVAQRKTKSCLLRTPKDGDNSSASGVPIFLFRWIQSEIPTSSAPQWHLSSWKRIRCGCCILCKNLNDFLKKNNFE